MLSFQLIDTISLSNKISSTFACQYSEDGRLFILTDSVVLIFTLMNYSDKLLSNFAFKKKHIETPKYNFSTELGIELDDFYDDLSRKDLYETALRLDLSGDLPFSTPVEFKITKSAWSPKGLLGKSKCLIAVLTNYFGLHIYAKEFTDGAVETYSCVANVTQQIIKLDKKSWGNIGHLSGTLQISELKKRVTNNCPLSFAWSNLFSIGDNKFALLFIGHPNGTIGAWKFDRRMEGELSQSILHLIGKCSTSLKRLIYIHWYQTTKLAGALTIADDNGNIVVYTVSIGQNGKSVIFEQENILWNESDKIKVEETLVFKYKKVIYLILVKQSFLLVFGIDENGSVFDQLVYDTGNFFITGILHYQKNKLIISSLSCTIKMLVFNTESNKIHVEEEVISLQLDASKYKTHGIIMSENKSLFGILASPSQIKNLVRNNTSTKCFLYHNTNIDCIEHIFTNCSDGIYKSFDCLEILRLLCFKGKKFPWEKMDQNLDYDKLSLPELKALKQIAILSENIYATVPYIEEYRFKAHILIHYLLTIKYVVKRMRKLLFIYSTSKDLTTFQLRSLDIQNMYLKEVVAKGILEKAQVGEQFIDDIIDVMEKANLIEYPPMPHCFWCGQRIIGPTCIPPHADSKCVISMMPIMLIPGYKCEFCHCVAHPEIAKEMSIVICPYCDYPMDQVYSLEMTEKKLKETSENLRNNTRIALGSDIPENPLIQCLSDCMQDKLNVNDIEDNTVEFVTISDEEDEEALNEKRKIMCQVLKEVVGSTNESKNENDFVSAVANEDSEDRKSVV